MSIVPLDRNKQRSDPPAPGEEALVIPMSWWKEHADKECHCTRCDSTEKKSLPVDYPSRLVICSACLVTGFVVYMTDSGV